MRKWLVTGARNVAKQGISFTQAVGVVGARSVGKV